MRGSAKYFVEGCLVLENVKVKVKVTLYRPPRA
jgi:hypothetical protein